VSVTDVESDGRTAQPTDAGSQTPPDPQLGWLAQLQRVSGVLLVPLGAIVFVYTYLANDVADLRAIDLERRWSNPALQLVDWAFLALALVHGLIGWHWFLGRHVANTAARWAIEGVSMTTVALAFAYGSLAVFVG
jgi:succinate dehydrogenase membrane anchor subunit